jgi:hypothetical protein
MVDPTLDEPLAEVRTATREHLGRLTEMFEERLTELDGRLRERSRRARRDLFERLGQAARRLKQFESQEQWSRALVEATEGLCGRAMLFAVQGPMLEFRAARNVSAPAPGPIRIAAAAAFAGVVETKDTVVALRTRGELGDAIVQVTGEAPGRRVTLFPLLSQGRVAAILYADAEDGQMETSALDLLASLGGAMAVAPRKNEPALELRAQRFARVRVAEMRLYQSQKVKSGRLQADLYSYLKSEIDTGREIFRRDFLSASAGMADYFHQELVETLANDNAALLGKAYPGPQVAGD